jgi:hypothetical protein
MFIAENLQVEPDPNGVEYINCVSISDLVPSLYQYRTLV